MTYDPALNQLYIGTGNGSPWSQKRRSPAGGDNLYLASIVAINATLARTSGTTRRPPATTPTSRRRSR